MLGIWEDTISVTTEERKVQQQVQMNKISFNTYFLL